MKNNYVSALVPVGNRSKAIPCANCGCFIENAKSVIPGDDGEWFCSKKCESEHDELGCPFEHGIEYKKK